MNRIACLAAALAILFCTSAAQAQWGGLKGKIVYDGKAPAPAKIVASKDPEVCGKFPLVDETLLVDENGGVKNVVVYVRDKGVKVHPDADKGGRIELDNKDCRFEPHVVTMSLSQTLVLKNSDPIAHNSNMSPLGGQAINPLLAAGGSVDYKFSKVPAGPGVTPVSCNIHPWMKAYVAVRDNPYITSSAADGTFEIKDLPAGEIEFQAWHEKPGYVETATWKKGRFKVKIENGKTTDLGEIKVKF